MSHKHCDKPNDTEQMDFENIIGWEEILNENFPDIPDNNDDEEQFFDAHESNESNDENENNEPEIQEEPEPEPDPQKPPQRATRHSTRRNFGKQPDRLIDFVVYEAHEKPICTEPHSYKDALNFSEWKQAMEEELDSLKENDTYEQVDLPPGRKANGCKWVFKAKLDGSGNVVRHKAQLVAQGFSQKFGIDYDEVFAPVARSTTFRLLLSVAGKQNYSVKQYDIKTAFLNGKLEEDIYMKQTPGY